MLAYRDAKARLAQWVILRDVGASATVPTEEPDDDDNGEVDFEAIAIEKIGHLSPLLQQVVADAFGCEIVDGKFKSLQHWEKIRAAEQRGVTQLAQLTDRQRQEIVEAVLPGFSPWVESTFDLLQRVPYQTSYARKPFRTSQTNHTAAKRGEWLKDILRSLFLYQPQVLTPTWLAVWAPYLGPMKYAPCHDDLGYLLAAVIDRGGSDGEEVLEILKASATNEHEIGSMGRHVTRALLTCSNPDAWQFMEKTLLAAQRQEGLRQVILETVDEAHPQAFMRIVRLILDEDLVRFSSVVRAVDVWVGLAWDSASPKVIKDTLKLALQYFESPDERKAALSGNDAEAVYLSLWCEAFTDVVAAVELAAPLLRHKKVEIRFAALVFLLRAEIEECIPLLAQAAEDPDLRISVPAIQQLQQHEFANDDPLLVKLFEVVEALVEKLPKEPSEQKPLVWPWMKVRVDRQAIAAALSHFLGSRSPLELVKYYSVMSGSDRHHALQHLTKTLPIGDPAVRQVLLDNVGDASTGTLALETLRTADITPEEAPFIEKLLTRKTPQTRLAALMLLAKQGESAALASADRLLSAGNISQRLAGLELLRILIEHDVQADACRAKAAAFAKARKKLSQEEQTQLGAIEKIGQSEWSLDNALGLLDPTKLTPRTPPRALDVVFFTDAAYGCLESLEQLIHEHRTDEATCEDPGENNGEVRLLGNYQWYFCRVDRSKPPAEAAKKLPLRALWEDWWQSRPAELRDNDGLELVRAAVLLEMRSADADEFKDSLKIPEAKQAAETMHACDKLPKFKYDRILSDVLDWLFYLHPQQGVVDYLLDAAEAAFAMVPVDLLNKPREERASNSRRFSFHEPPECWREFLPFAAWMSAAESSDFSLRSEWITAQNLRLWRLQHWRDWPTPGTSRERPDLALLLLAWQRGEANEHDLYDHLLGPRNVPMPAGSESKADEVYRARDFDSLSSLTQLSGRRDDKAEVASLPKLVAVLDNCRERILEIELARGEQATVATRPALALRSLYGTASLMRILTEINKGKLKKQRYSWSSDGDTRTNTLTHLLGITYPLANDTPQQFTKDVAPLRKSGVLTDQRLLELVFLAPQWLPHVEHCLKWQGLSEGVYWYLAHMAYSDKGVLNEIEVTSEGSDAGEMGSNKKEISRFDRIVAERTPLSDEVRGEGAVDVNWFRKAYAAVGAKRWQQVAEAAKHASSPQQAGKAEQLGQVILGKMSRAKLVDDIRKKNLKHSVRLLGLLPLPNGTKRGPELIARYRVLNEYHRYAKGLSAMSKPDALRAVEIGMANLASTAGYPDALRMTWALEAESLADLQKGPVQVTAEGVTVSLSIGEDFVPQISYARGDKPLKSGPATVKKNKKVAELLQRASELKKQTPRIKASLETMMCRGDEFTAGELRELAEHPLLWPHLSRLVLVGNDIMGYPDKRGQALRNASGKLEPVKKSEKLRIAHPVDLYESKQWPAWQHECFTAERIQPCKQVFRELYLLTKTERADKTLSRRYAGQQIQPRQAMALFGARGWRTQDGVEKFFHDAEIGVSVDFVSGWGSPLDVEGWTIDAVRFYKRNHLGALPLAQVPKRLFSEAMRDLDLVVSVAHRGEVDPEASASTVEMRTSLLRETCQLMGIRNVKFKTNHAIIKGKLGEYSVHLGSGVVHKLPGGSLCIVAVGAQHRGRLFLPFADDDPRTAEVISKVMLLARDESIQDPTILEQIQR
jgi:hypothetical protein